MKELRLILRDIESIKIQGAQNVAKAAADAMGLVFNRYKDDRSGLIYHLNQAREALVKTRPTEPCMRNVLHYLMREVNDRNILHEFPKRQVDIKHHFTESEKKISHIGSNKVIDGHTIFTHCHSSTVTKALIEAKKLGKRFKVFNSETRPLFQGRITAKELNRAGIAVTHFVDSAGRIALKEADIMMIGADAVSSEGKVYNKIGSELFAEVAEKFDVPLYVCTDSWKFDPKSVFGFEPEIEKRTAKEVWPTVPAGVTVDNRAFEKVDPDLISGIISELGIFKPEIFVGEVRRSYPWMF